MSDTGGLYGSGAYTFNMHSLVHLTADVRQFGCLASFSAFPFEAFLAKIKRFLKASALPTEQVFMRAAELKAKPWQHVSTGIKLSQVHSDGPVPEQFHGRQFKKLTVGNTVLSTKPGDCSVKLKDGNILARNFLLSGEDLNLWAVFWLFTKFLQQNTACCRC